MKKFFKDRRVIFLIIVIIIGVIFGARLVNLQIVNGAAYNDAAYRKLLGNSGIKAVRGDILDRNGYVIATSRTGYSGTLIQTIFPII
jgi:cell division protein FtsI/penicillin-binding protein 2